MQNFHYFHRLHVAKKLPSGSEASIEDDEDSTGLGGDIQGGSSSSHGQVAKPLVQHGLACEYS